MVTGLLALFAATFYACTDLDETIYSELSTQNFFNNRTEVMQAALRPFTHMQAWLAPTGQNGYFYHAELSADQLAWPQKGRHGYDGGDHFRQHYHTWTDNENRMRTAWTLIWTGVGYVNSALESLTDLDHQALEISDVEMAAIIAELHVLRAFHYMKNNGLVGKCSHHCQSWRTPESSYTNKGRSISIYQRGVGGVCATTSSLR